MRQKVIKNYFRILKKTHAYLQTILKAPVKFQKDRTKTVGGVKGTRYLLKIRNHSPRWILKYPHAYLQAILKAHVKFQKDRPKTVGGVKDTFWIA